jgi:acetoin utilization protein AcuC
MAGRASGVCVYNDPAIAIKWLLGQGAERVAYVDIDVHHGDGVQAAFWADPRVLTISLHEHPATLFPGTGLPTEIGAAGAEGSAVNVALPAGTRDAGWLRAFHATVPPLLRAFRPQVLVSQHGCDTHWSDPLANLELSIDAQRAAHAARSTRLAPRDRGGAGWRPGAAVIRWSRWCPGPGPTPLRSRCGPRSTRQRPRAWREYVRRRTGRTAPGSMTEGQLAEFISFDSGYDPAEPVDRAIMATRNAVFPLHGLMPLH